VNAKEPDAFREMTRRRFAANESDHETLRQAASDYKVSRAQLDAANAANDRVCPRILDGSIQGGPAIAAYFELLVQQRLNREESYYRGVLDRLSPSVRTRIMNSLDDSVASASYGTLDHVGVASEMPDLYEAMMKSRCEELNNSTGGIRQGVITE
jgi:hypothetical protein